MPSGKLETIQDCEDFVQGCLFMGTGGGGPADLGLKLLKEALDEGLSLEWVDAEDIPDDTLTVTVFDMGSIAPISEETKQEIEESKLEMLDELGDRTMARAVQALSSHTGKNITCIVPVELGASNTPAPIITAARLGIPAVDGDYSGRAVPEELQGTPYLYGKDSWPFASVDCWGSTNITTYAPNGYMVERIGKQLSIAGFYGTSIASTLLPANEMKDILVEGTLTRCLKLGKALREAREQGQNPIDAALKETHGWRLFEGVVTKKEWEDRDGYMFGTITIEGRADFKGHRLEVWLKNENHVTWLDGKPYVCSPDLVTLAYKDSGTGTTNDLIAEGDEIVAVGMKGLESFRSEFGLACSGPRYFGFDIDYVPIEELMKS